MNRNLDGVYFRVNRDGKWESICFSDLTEAEMREIMEGREVEWLKNLCVILGTTLHDIGDDYDIVGA